MTWKSIKREIKRYNEGVSDTLNAKECKAIRWGSEDKDYPNFFLRILTVPYKLDC